MSDTIPNIIVPADTVVDIYADAGVVTAGILVGQQILAEMIGEGEAKLYSGETLASEPLDADGFAMLYSKEQKTNETGDVGAFIWSRQGCTINVSLF